MLHRIPLVIGILAACVITRVARAAAPQRPNIVYILCDDLGIGDVHAMNPQRGKIPTPNVDQLAAEGMSFTDAHSGSSLCSPSRYCILTGRYAWRTRLQTWVLLSTSPPLIAPQRMTVASLLKAHGYATGAIGKWHLGLTVGKNEFADPILDGPLQHGFDYYFGIAASMDMPPFDYIENDHFTEIPTTEKTWVRKGPAAADFDAMNVLPDLTKKATKFIADHAADAKKKSPDGKPIFLYVAFNTPHAPVLPTPAWQGKSGLGPYGDYVMETDWATGEILKAIDQAGLADSTLVIFTSDNGCAPTAEPKKLEAMGHFPSAQYRGYKSDIWDGGHRIPFIVRWPGHVAAASHSDALICQVDLLATCADMLGVTLPTNAGEDSVSDLPLLSMSPAASVRDSVVHHSGNGKFAIRKGKWKLEFCPGSGGWSSPTDPIAKQQGLPMMQLYDMESDVGEKNNIAADHPDVVKELTALIERDIKQGRTVPGPAESNDVHVVLHKPVKAPKPAAKSANG